MDDTPHTSLAAQHPGKGYVGWLVWLSMLLLVVGLFAPLMTLTKLHFFKNQVSIYTGLIGLFEEGHYGLFLVILVFSVCFPLYKIFQLAYVWHVDLAEATRKKRLHWTEMLGRWSMLDVFVVALVVVTAKLGALADVEVHAGIYFFAAAVLASMAASLWMTRLAARAPATPTDEGPAAGAAIAAPTSTPRTT